MALLVPYVGANIALEALVNKTAPQNLVLNLFANNITPSNTDTAVTYTAATFAGYAPAAISGTGWGSAASGVITYASQITFTCSTTGATNNIYGYYVTQTTSGTLVWAERDPAAPFGVTNAGDAIKITPTISA